MSSSSSKPNGVDRVKKGPWSFNEDKLLKKHVKKNGHRNWSLISKFILGRSAKSCRERWCNHLSPDVNHGAFTKEEDEKIIRFQAEHHNKWATMARMLPGRTDNAIKNRWHSTLKRKGLSSDNNNFGGVGGSERHENTSFNVGSGASILPTGYNISDSPSGSNSINNFMGPHDGGPVEKVGGMHDSLTNLSLSLFDINFTESHSQFPSLRVNSPPLRVNSPPPNFNQGGFGSPFMMAPVVEPVHPVVDNGNENETINENFGGDLLAIMQHMIREEVRNYMEGFEKHEEQRRLSQMVQQRGFIEHQQQRQEQHYHMYMQQSNEHPEVHEPNKWENDQS